MTLKQFYKLRAYDDTLFTALYCDYFRNLSQVARDELDAMYEELFNKKGGIKASCGACQLRSLKELAKPYFQMKEKMEKKKEEKKNEDKKEEIKEEEITQETIEENGEE